MEVLIFAYGAFWDDILNWSLNIQAWVIADLFNCVFYTFICRQNDSSELDSSIILLSASCWVYRAPAHSWCALGFLGLNEFDVCLVLLVTDCSEVSKFVTHFAPKFSHRTLESFGMHCVATSDTSIRLFFHLSEIKGFLWHLFCGPVVLHL